MTEIDAQQVAALVVQTLKDEGLVHDERPLLSLDAAARRLGVSRRVLGDLIAAGPNGEPPHLATVKVIPGGQKGVMVEPRELDHYLERQRRATWMASTRRDTP